MPWSELGRNRRATVTSGLADSVSMHTADPGASGTANEWSGGGYSRQTPSWSAGGTGVRTATLEFEGPANAAAAFIGLWEGSDFLGGFARTGGDTNANAAGEYGATIPMTSNA